MKKVTKSLTALLLALVMSLTLLPTQALAAESAAKPRSYTASYTNPLYAGIADSGASVSTQTAPAAYAASVQAADTGYLTTKAAVIKEMRSQMIDRQSTIEFKVKMEPGTIDLKEWWQEAISHVTGDGSSGDFLRWQFKSYGAGAEPEMFNKNWTGGYEITYTVTWYTTTQQEFQLNTYIKNTILPQLSLSGKTTYQKVQAIYNWITKNVKYDYTHLNDDTYKLQFTAYAAAINKTAVCQGYANLFYRLANDAGIDCRMISGTANGGDGVWGPHAWNIVKLDDGSYYCLDATWDAGQSNYTYFLKGTAAFGKDHRVNTASDGSYFWSDYPVSDTDFDPDALAAPSVTGGNSSSGKPQLTWKAVPGAARYEVYRSTKQNSGFTLLGTTTATSYVNTGAAAGTTYYYKVRAVSSAGKYGAYSNVVSGKVKAAAPAAPSITGGYSATGKPQLTWKAVTGAASYEVYRSTQQSTGFTKINTTTATSYVNTGAAAGTIYYYKVRAVNSDGLAGAYSNVVSGSVKSTVPGTPSVTIGLSSASGKPQLTWSAVTGAAKYEVYRSTQKDSGFTKINTTTATSYVNTGAAAGTIYYYKVRAVNSDGLAGAYSNVVSGSVKSTVPGTPSVTIGLSSASGKPQLTWSAVTGAASYEVYRSTQKDSGFTKINTTTATSYVNTGAAAGTTYYYKVRALNSAGTAGAYSNVVSGRAKAAIPAAPSVTIGNSSSSGKPQLTWKAVADAAKYEIYRSTQQSAGFTLLGTTTSTSYVNTGAALGTTYYYKVRALNVDGAAGAYSSTVSGAAKAVAPAAPTVTMTHSDSGKPKLTWSAVSGATSYRVYRSESRGTGYGLLGTTTSTSYVNTGAAVGKTYYYRVKAVNSAGTSGYSNIVSGTARTPAPSAPVLKGGTSSASGKPQLTWAAVSGAETYDVYRCNSAGGTFSKVGSTDKTTYVNTGAVQGVTYFYKIRAVGSSGASGFSNTVEIHVAGVVKAPAAVALSGIKADAAGITVTWKATANADTYNVLRKDASNTAWKVIARSVSGTSYKDTTVTRGVKYTYTVQGVAADGVTTGPYDTTGKSATVTASASTTPGYVTMKGAQQVTTGTKGILLTWTTASNAKTYNVYRAANPPKSGDTLLTVPTSKWVLVAEKVSALSWKDTTGTSGTTYAYMVRGVAADGKTLSTSYNTVGVRATMP